MAWKKKKNTQNKPAETTERKPETNYESNYKDLVRESVPFTNYYKAQGIVPDEEWDAFISTLQTTLPAAFRVVPTSGLWGDLKKYFDKSCEASENWLNHIDFYPDGFAYQFAHHDRVAIRKSKELSSIVSECQKVLQLETQRGGIQRQETVSMIPPLLLNVKSGHTVLDMCAAPGSKTSQIIDLIHGDARKRAQAANAILPNICIAEPERGDGMVLANEVDTKRAGILAHNLSRLPSSTIGVTIQDASTCGMLRANLKELNKKDRQMQNAPPLFDRVLADVPCSGDGTLRKNPDVWKYWGLSSGMGLHAKQLQILKRGYALLKPGGRLVFSTCSFNPLENEAVVAAFLTDEPTAILASEPLPSLSNGASPFKIRPGVSDWKVVDPRDETCQAYLSEIPPKPVKPTTEDAPAAAAAVVAEDDGSSSDEEEEAEESTPVDAKVEAPEGVDAPVRTKKRRNPLRMLRSSMFAAYNSAEVLSQMNKCMRVFPQDNNSGGFFIAVFDKPGTEAMDPCGEDGKSVVQTSESEASSPIAKRAKVITAAADVEDIVIETEGADNVEEILAAETAAEQNVREAPENQSLDVASCRLGSVPNAIFTRLDALFGLTEQADGNDGTREDLLFPSLPLTRSRLLTRDAASKKVFLSSRQGAVELNARLLNGGSDMRWVTLGTRVFQRFATASRVMRDAEAASAEGRDVEAAKKNALLNSTWRLCQDGVKALVPYMSRRVMIVSRQFGIELLKTGSMEYEKVVKNEDGTSTASANEENRVLLTTQARGIKQLFVNGNDWTEGINHGSVAVIILPSVDDLTVFKSDEELKQKLRECDSELVVAGVIGVKKLEVYVTKQDRIAMLHQLEVLHQE